MTDQIHCSKCHKPNDRKGQRYCLKCHAGIQKRYRARLRAERKALDDLKTVLATVAKLEPLKMRAAA